MSGTPVPRDPGRDEHPPGTPAGPGDHPSLGAPGWRLVPCSPDWERWAEDSGNAGLAGRELPPAQVLAADQRVSAWAKELRKAGLDGDMDVLRARAYLDILLGMDSRPLGTGRTALRRTKGWGAVFAALVSGLVLRSLCYTVTASRSAVTAAV